jgi:uncharacterized coiled-coil protein SlyX
MKDKLITIFVTVSLIFNIYLLSTLQSQEKVTELEATVTELEDNVTELEATVTELEATVTELDNEITRQDELLMWVIENVQYCGNLLGYLFDYFGRDTQIWSYDVNHKDGYYCSVS